MQKLRGVRGPEPVLLLPQSTPVKVTKNYEPPNSLIMSSNYTIDQEHNQLVLRFFVVPHLYGVHTLNRELYENLWYYILEYSKIPRNRASGALNNQLI